MSAEQEKDPISLKRVRGNREGRRIEGVGGGGVGCAGPRAGLVGGHGALSGPNSAQPASRPRLGADAAVGGARPSGPLDTRGALASPTLC